MKQRAWVVRVYAIVLRVFPPEFRHRYGDEMVEFFEACWAASREQGRVRVVAKAFSHAVVHGLLERAGTRRRPGLRREMMGGVTNDVRFALRGLRRQPGFTVVAALTIALGIGAASAVFAVVDAVVFRPLPYSEPDRLVAVWTRFDGQGDFGMSLAEHFDYAEESSALAALGSFTSSTSTLTGLGEARRIDVVWTWGELFEVIGAHVALGRLPSAEDARSGAAPVAVISHEFWVSAFSGDSQTIGRTLVLDQTSVEIIGVMTPEVTLPRGVPTIWRPIARDRADIVDRSGHSLEGIGRLAAGASVSTLRAEIAEVHARWHTVWAGVHSPGHPGHSFATSSLH